MEILNGSLTNIRFHDEILNIPLHVLGEFKIFTVFCDNDGEDDKRANHRSQRNHQVWIKGEHLRHKNKKRHHKISALKTHKTNQGPDLVYIASEILKKLPRIKRAESLWSIGF